MTDTAASNRSVVVTGASSGIGRACAMALDGLGYRVYAGYRKEADGDALRAAGSGRMVPIRLDVTSAEEIAAAAERVRDETAGAGLTGLVNNAGIGLAGPLEFIPIDALRRQLEVNVIGQIAVTQAFLPRLREGGGRVISVGSISGRFASPFLGPYSASKFALEALTDSLRVELSPWRIHVSIIEPGAIDTPIWERSSAAAQAMIDQMPAEAEEYYGRPMRRLQEMVANIQGTPTDPVVEAVVHALTSPEPRARYVVGRDARVRLWMSRLPTALRDALVRRALRI